MDRYLNYDEKQTVNPSFLPAPSNPFPHSYSYSSPFFLIIPPQIHPPLLLPLPPSLFPLPVFFPPTVEFAVVQSKARTAAAL